MGKQSSSFKNKRKEVKERRTKKSVALNATNYLSNSQFFSGQRNMGARNPVGFLNSKTVLKAMLVLFSSFHVFQQLKLLVGRMGQAHPPLWMCTLTWAWCLESRQCVPAHFCNLTYACWTLGDIKSNEATPSYLLSKSSPSARRSRFEASNTM